MPQSNESSAVKHLDQFKGLLGKAYYFMDKLDEKAIALAVYERVREKAVYRIIFKTKKGPVEISGLSVDGAEELYRLCRFRGLVPLLEVKDIKDTQANGYFITTIIWRVLEPTLPPTTWELITRGSAALGEDLFERKALGKAQRNAQLKVIPLVVREAMKAVLGAKLGVKELVWDEEEAAPVETKNGDATASAQTSDGRSERSGGQGHGPDAQNSPNPSASAPSSPGAPPPLPPQSKRPLTKVVQINGKRLRTAGIEAKQLIALWEAAERHGREKVAELIKTFGVEKSNYLTKEEADQVLKRLNGAAGETPVKEKSAMLPV